LNSTTHNENGHRQGFSHRLLQTGYNQQDTSVTVTIDAGTLEWIFKFKIASSMSQIAFGWFAWVGCSQRSGYV
jgi:hypothetical protein